MTIYFETVYICKKCGKRGIRIKDRMAGQTIMRCPGCGTLKSKSNFNRETRPIY